MYCVHCGAEGAVAFCAACGQRQPVASVTDNVETENPEPDIVDAEILDAIPVLSISSESDADWMNSIQYEVVLANSEARNRISTAGRDATEGVTGDDLLAVFDAISPIGFSLGKLTHAILPIYDKLGIKTGHESQGIFDSPPGRVILAVLCTLASKSLAIASVHQDPEKCSLAADIPSSLITNRGKLHVLIEVHETHISLSLATTISGQWYDWGRSKRIADEIFEAVHQDLTSQQSGHPPQFRRVA